MFALFFFCTDRCQTVTLVKSGFLFYMFSCSTKQDNRNMTKYYYYDYLLNSFYFRRQFAFGNSALAYNICKDKKRLYSLQERVWLLVYSLVQWNCFSDVTGCIKFRCIQWHQRTNFTAPGCTRMVAVKLWAGRFFGTSWLLVPITALVMGRMQDNPQAQATFVDARRGTFLASKPGPHRHRIYNRQEEGASSSWRS